jgi:hypothetical protein
MSTTSTTKSEHGPWFKLVWIVPIILVGVAIIVFAANLFRESAAGVDFLKTYPGRSELPKSAPIGFPAWLEWQHFLSAIFILLIVRTGIQIRTTRRPPAFWTRNNAGLLKTKGQPVRIGLSLWFHLTVDILWILNGIVFYVLLFVTGQWVRIIPVHWDIFPNALSAGLRRRLVELQRTPAGHLLHHRLRRGTARHPHGSSHGSGARAAVQGD